MNLTISAKTVRYKGVDCFVALSDYERGFGKRISLRSLTNGEHVAILTTYLPNLLPGEVAVKDGYWLLLHSGIIKGAHSAVFPGNEVIYICNLREHV